jgi:hypothetical protein
MASMLVLHQRFVKVLNENSAAVVVTGTTII